MKKLKLILGIFFTLLFGAFTYLVSTYDVATVGPDGTSVGFANLNLLVHETTGVNLLWYNITDYIGYLAIAIAGLFAIIGLIQMIKRRSLFKVDREIIALGVLFVVVIGLYVAFEKVIINYRPIILPDETSPEASYPSSHTMLIVTVIGAAMMLLGHYLEKGVGRTLLGILGIAIILVTIGGRLYCGVHWLTDIIGGMLLSLALIEFYSAAIEDSPSDRTYDYVPRTRTRSRSHVSNKRGTSTKGYVPKH